MMTPEQKGEQVMAWLRLLRVRVFVLEHELIYIRANLQLGVVSPDEALDWVDELDPRLRPIVEGTR